MIRPASEVSAGALHKAMLRGFSDYVVPLQPGFAQFETIMARRSFVPELSLVAEEGGEVVAVWLVGRRADRAYLIASATVPEARRRGLARGLAERCLAELGGAGIARMQTEVIIGNEAAKALYMSLGFEVIRTLSCFEIPPSAERGDLQPVRLADLAGVSFGDWPPSWQNADAALAAAPAPLCLGLREGGALQGYAVFMPESGTIAQIAVAPAFRRQGIGTRLVHGVQAAVPGQGLRLLNADAGDAGFARFMASLDARVTVEQLELRKELGANRD